MADQDHGGGIDRRVVLRWTWRGLVAGLVVNGVWTAYDVLVPRVEGGFGGAVAAGAEAGFPDGEVRYFPERRFYVTPRIGGTARHAQRAADARVLVEDQRTGRSRHRRAGHAVDRHATLAWPLVAGFSQASSASPVPHGHSPQR